MTLALLGALAIGLSLGLLGSGGSILTVPVLVYGLGQPDKVAIAGSLAIVGAISLVGAVPFAWRRKIDWRSVAFFGVPGMLGSFGGAYLAHYVSGTAQLLAFAVVMLIAAYAMLRGGAGGAAATAGGHAAWKIALEGLVVGVITGLVGVGGGFLIVPALVLLGGLPMVVAIGTSLVIIALKSMVGFVEYLQVLNAVDLTLDWTVLAVFIVVGILGSIIGGRLGGRVPELALKRGFATVLVVVSAFVLWQNVPLVV